MTGQPHTYPAMPPPGWPDPLPRDHPGRRRPPPVWVATAALGTAGLGVFLVIGGVASDLAHRSAYDGSAFDAEYLGWAIALLAPLLLMLAIAALLLVKAHSAGQVVLLCTVGLLLGRVSLLGLGLVSGPGEDSPDPNSWTPASAGALVIGGIMAVLAGMVLAAIMVALPSGPPPTVGRPTSRSAAGRSSGASLAAVAATLLGVAAMWSQAWRTYSRRHHSLATIPSAGSSSLPSRW